MDINIQIAKNQQFQAFYLFFIISSSQLGVGMIGTPRIVYEKAGHDAWISIILAQLFVLLVISVMLFTLGKYDNTDLIGIQADLFGGFVSKILGTIYIIYFGAHILSTLVTYIEIIRVFIFPDFSAFVLGLMLLSLIVYTSVGGLKVIIGVIFLFLIFSNWMIFLLIQPATQMVLLNFLPIMDSDVMEILDGAIATAYTFMGFEILFFIYPFVNNKKNIRLPAMLGASWAALIVFLTAVISIGFFSSGQLDRRIWPVLSLFKQQTSPLIERMDYLVVAEWMMVTVPRMILLTWGITYIAKRLYKIPTKISLYISSGILLALIPFFTEHFEVQVLIDSVRNFGIWIVYVYPFILFPLVFLKKRKVKRNQGGINHESK